MKALPQIELSVLLGKRKLITDDDDGVILADECVADVDRTRIPDYALDDVQKAFEDQFFYYSALTTPTSCVIAQHLKSCVDKLALRRKADADAELPAAKVRHAHDDGPNMSVAPTVI